MYSWWLPTRRLHFTSISFGDHLRRMLFKISKTNQKLSWLSILPIGCLCALSIPSYLVSSKYTSLLLFVTILGTPHYTFSITSFFSSLSFSSMVSSPRGATMTNPISYWFHLDPWYRIFCIKWWQFVFPSQCLEQWSHFVVSYTSQILHPSSKRGNLVCSSTPTTPYHAY